MRHHHPEHEWGDWSYAADQLECEPDTNGWFVTPSHKVTRRGRHDGAYTKCPWPPRPSFSGFGMTANTGYFARVAIKQNDLNKFAKFVLVVRVFNGWRTELRWDVDKQNKLQL